MAFLINKPECMEMRLAFLLSFCIDIYASLNAQHARISFHNFLKGNLTGENCVMTSLSELRLCDGPLYRLVGTYQLFSTRVIKYYIISFQRLVQNVGCLHICALILQL